MSLTDINNNNLTIDNNCKPNYYLLFSTSTLIFPSLYALKKKNNTLVFCSIMALAGSLNYWRKPCIGYRKNIDLLTSKLSVLGYFYYGYNNLIGFYPRMLGYFKLFLMYKYYNNSCNAFHSNNPNWVNYHITFHLIGTITQLYVIYWV
jgi:hypothetical protein